MFYRPPRFLHILFLLASCLPLVVAAASNESDGANSRPSIKSDYVLQPQDLLRIQVFQEPDLDREVRVSQEQTVFLPLIGAVEVKGKTVRDAGEQIRALYDKDYLVNPQVNVIVVEYSKRFVKVFGSVASPGVVEFPPEQGLTLLEAIARAGSFNRLADTKKVVLTRTYADGRTESIPVNADDLTKRGEGEDVPLQPDDVIYVGERIL